MSDSRSNLITRRPHFRALLNFLLNHAARVRWITDSKNSRHFWEALGKDVKFHILSHTGGRERGEDRGRVVGTGQSKTVRKVISRVDATRALVLKFTHSFMSADLIASVGKSI